MQRVALRYVEAEIFATFGAGRFLHTELKSALKQTLSELLDLAFLEATREYGCEVVEPGPTIEKHGRKHILFMKQLTGIVPPPGRLRSISTTAHSHNSAPGFECSTAFRPSVCGVATLSFPFEGNSPSKRDQTAPRVGSG